MPITLAIAEAKLTEALDAHTKIMQGQSVTMNVGGVQKSLSRADLEFVLESIEMWDKKSISLGGAGTGGPKLSYAQFDSAGGSV
jgi:hypothetical protein